MEAHLQELDEVGYTTFSDLLSPDEVAEAVAALHLGARALLGNEHGDAGRPAPRRHAHRAVRVDHRHKLAR